jgi:DNA mismatch repair protein MutS2
MRFEAGDHVHVASFGKGVVREVRNSGRYLVDVKGAAMVVSAAQLTAVDERRRANAPAPSRSNVEPVHPARAHAAASLDLHGRTTMEATALLDEFLNEALLAGLPEVRVIHGRSGGRVRSTIHQHLRHLPIVRRFRLDPSNPGVTIVSL